MARTYLVNLHRKTQQKVPKNQFLSKKIARKSAPVTTGVKIPKRH